MLGLKLNHVSKRGHRGAFWKCLHAHKSTLKSSLLNKLNIFQGIYKIFCVEFQKVTLKFPPKDLAHTLKDMILYPVAFKSSQIYKTKCVFEITPHPSPPPDAFSIQVFPRFAELLKDQLPVQYSYLRGDTAA